MDLLTLVGQGMK